MGMEFHHTDHLTDGEIRLVVVWLAEAVPEKDWVPAYHFSVQDMQGTPMGSCDLRIGYNQNLYFGGHIGYRVEEPYRGHHYAEKACRLLFPFAREHGMEYLYITCAPDNLPSRRTCERLGGELLEIAELPPDSDMRQEGMTEVCVFRYNLVIE